MKETSAATSASQSKLLERGGERLTLTLPPETAQKWRQVVSQYGNQHGAKMAAFRDMLERALAHEEPTNADLLAMLERRLR